MRRVPAPEPRGAEDDPIRIGARLRSARRAQGLTIERVAASADLTKGFISRIERDETNPSVGSLVRLCNILGITVGSLFDDVEATQVSVDTASLINFGGHGSRDLLLTPTAERRFVVIHSTIEPGGGAGEELYTLDSEAELVFVLSGRIEVRFRDREQTLSVGDALTFSPQEPHSWRNPADSSAAEALWVLSPAL